MIMGDEESWIADGVIGQTAAFALEVTDSVIWAINIDTGETIMTQGPAASLFNLEGVESSGVESFFEEAVHPDDWMEIQQLYIDLVQGNTEEFKVIFRTHPKNGDVSWIDSHARIQVADGARILTGISTDVTELKRHEQEVEAQNERLEGLTRILSHDLRNPLNVAQGRIQLAIQDDDTVQLEDALQALNRMETLITDLLTLSLDSEASHSDDHSSRRMEPVVVAALAEGCWQNVDTATAELVIESDLTIQTNRSRLQQLFENLYRNAIEHAGTDITVTVGDLHDPPGFYIADTGPGIPEDQRDEIFTRGYSTTKNGYGLGLHIVNNIVETHGWDLTVTDAEPHGARFEITGVETP